MKNKEIKEMTTRERRDLLLHKVQWYAICVLWNIRDDEPEVMLNVQRYKQCYRVYRNMKRMLGEDVYTSPRIDLVITMGHWESF